MGFERLGTFIRGTEGRIPIHRSDAKTLILHSDISAIIAQSIRGNLEALLACEMTDEKAAAELHQIAPAVLQWIDAITSVGVLVKQESLSPVSQAIRNEAAPPDVACFFFVAEGIAESEETIWCPSVGIKGQIDLILRGRVEMRVYAAAIAAQHIAPLQENPLALHASVFDSPLCRETVGRTQLPMELKTGKWRPQSAVGHRAQVRRYQGDDIYIYIYI